MGRIVILPDDVKSSASYLSHHPLPLSYMSDYSVMGLRVNRYRDALVLLRESGYQLAEKNCGTDVGIRGPGHIQDIRQLLAANDIACEIGDIADSLYQA